MESEDRAINENCTIKSAKYYESNAGDGTKATDQYLSGIKLVLILISCVTSLFIVALDQTIISTLLTDVGDQFKSFSDIGWLTSGFLLPLATLTPSYGKISIAFGRKNTIIVGIIIFEIGSLISGVATSMDMLIGGRVIQGIGGGAVQAMVVVILTESVPISKRPLSYVLLGVTFSVASVLGPFVGGAFASHVTWRWCFYVNLPIGGLAIFLIVFSFNPPKPEGNLRQKLSKIDYIGTFLLTSGLVLVLLALTFGGITFPWKSAAVICCFTIGGVLLVLFGYYNFQISKNPIIIKEIIIVPQIFAACISAMFNFAFFLLDLTFLAIYFQVVRNSSAWQSGIDLIPMVISVSLASVFNGAFIRYTRYVKITMMLSAILGPIGNGLLLLLTKDSSASSRIGLLIIVGIPCGLQFQSSLLAAQLKAPRDVEGSLILVTIFLNFVKSVGAAVSVTLGELIFQTTSSKYINESLGQLSKDSEAYRYLDNISPKALIQSPKLIRELPEVAQQLVLDAFMIALKNVFYFGLGLSIVSLIAALFTTNRRIPRNEDVKQKGDDENVVSVKEDDEEKNTVISTSNGSNNY